MQFIANPSRTERVEKEGSSLYDPGGLQGGSSVAIPKLGGVIGVVRVVFLRFLTELSGKSGMKGV